jgi:excisionase family DNA binding protein
MTVKQAAERAEVSAMLVSPYLRTEEAALYLRTTVQGIYSLVKRRRLFPMPGRPGRLLFTREALDRYLQGKRPN